MRVKAVRDGHYRKSRNVGDVFEWPELTKNAVPPWVTVLDDGEAVSEAEVYQVSVRLPEDVDESLKGETTVSEPKETAEYPQHVGGAYFVLSNGEKVKGKEEAEAAQAALDK